MVPDQFFSPLRQSLRLRITGGSFLCGVQEMAALRSIVFRTKLAESPRVIETEVPKQVPKLEPPETRVYRVRRSTSSGPSDRYAPYRLLWVKVIIRAAYDYALWKDSKDLRHRKFAEDARKWLFETSDLENSLAHLCELWGLPLEKIRRFARNLTKEDVKKLEFKERQGRDLTPPSLVERVGADARA